MLCDLKIQFERAMNDGKYHLAEPHVTAIAALNETEGLYRYHILLCNSHRLCKVLCEGVSVCV